MIVRELLSASIFMWDSPPAACTPPAMAALVNRREYAAAVERSHLCLAVTKDPYFHFAAAQAFHYDGDQPAAKRELEDYNRKATASDPHRDAAAALLIRVRAALPEPPPNPPRTQPSRSGRKTWTPKRTAQTPSAPVANGQPTVPSAAEPVAEPATPIPATPSGTASEPATNSPGAPEVRESVPIKRDVTATSAPAPTPTEPPSVPSETRPADSRPSFRRGWIGLGIGAGTAGVVSVAIGLPGGLIARNAFQDNERALQTTGLDDKFDYGSCDTKWSTQCEAADSVERQAYPTSSYHRDLALASRMQTAATLTGGVALGGLVGALPIRLRDSRRRRVGLAAVFGGGLLTAVGGAVFFSFTRKSLGEPLEGLDSEGNGHAWRTSRDEFWHHQGQSLVAAALLGFGAGTAIGSGIAWLADGRARKGGGTRAGIRVMPTMGGLLVVGRF